MIVIAATEDTETCFALRHEVFVQEQGFSEEGEVDDKDAASLHLMAHQGDTPVATARVFVDGSDAKIGRVCVVQDLRGRGLGADLIEACKDLAAQQPGVTRAILGAQATATGFYEKLGFVPFGPLYDDEGVPHQWMACDLK
ncbi:GNAT family N-acetyltransferase [Sulfitobacter sp. S190]|uniref:GNAT family N-acetyltransferase n=1 Tax=Sulfitobacter sp. S190 TaxID=2867022 RepID=UPI0021A2E3EB|nr:GNAT family N-acetyltransferase [Sulfitobacter sp. S190]UWR22397.1 GNAT family N-acetyltransferase [Sulfitobacter sp. S190]